MIIMEMRVSKKRCVKVGGIAVVEGDKHGPIISSSGMTCEAV